MMVQVMVVFYLNLVYQLVWIILFIIYDVILPYQEELSFFNMTFLLNDNEII